MTLTVPLTAFLEMMILVMMEQGMVIQMILMTPTMKVQMTQSKILTTSIMEMKSLTILNMEIRTI
jgi:hypothetical protein